MPSLACVSGRGSSNCSPCCENETASFDSDAHSSNSCSRTTFGSCGLIRGMPVMARTFNRPRSSSAMAALSYGITAPGPVTIASSTRSRSRVEVISALTLTRVSRISTLRSACSNPGIVQRRCRGLRDGTEQKEVVFVEGSSIQLVDDFDARRLRSPWPPGARPWPRRCASSRPALRRCRRSSSGSSMIKGSPESETSAT